MRWGPLPLDGGDLEGRGRGTNYRSPANITELIKMSITVATQTSASVISFHFNGQSSINKVFLSCVVVSNMVGYLCCIASVLLVRRRPSIAESFRRDRICCYCHRVLTNDSYVPPQLSLDCWHSLCCFVFVCCRGIHDPTLKSGWRML